jgi:flavin reductase (DIM6/NTAB) family NADH-FMN oxidoreductase RutF
MAPTTTSDARRTDLLGTADRATTHRFDELMTRLDNPMVVVTTASGRVRAGCLVGFHTQCGIDPPAYAVWLSKANHTYRVGALSDTFAVHFLGSGDRDLAELFGATTGDATDKFARCDWERGPDGVPVLSEVRNRFVGRRVALFDSGADHVCLVLRPVEASAGEEGLLWLGEVADLEAGHTAEERQLPR